MRASPAKSLEDGIRGDARDDGAEVTIEELAKKKVPKLVYLVKNLIPRNAVAPSAFTHISTGVVYASPGVVNMPPCVLQGCQIAVCVGSWCVWVGVTPRRGDRRTSGPCARATSAGTETRMGCRLTDTPATPSRNRHIPHLRVPNFHL